MHIQSFYYCEACKTDHLVPPADFHAAQAPRTTPTGIPYIDCTRCGINHPTNREHCRTCDSPSIFVNLDTLLCLNCDKK